MSQMLFRHSNRTPIYIYKTSPCPLLVYPGGLGAITKVGVQQAFNLGLLLRDRYISTFSSIYEDFLAHIYIRSTDVDRCIQTSLAMLYSMFPVDKTSYEWNQSINWYPIPIHTIPAKHDSELKSEDSGCQKLDKLLNERLKSKIIQDFLLPHNQFLDMLSEKTGSKISAETIWNIYQTLKIELMDSKSVNPICGKTSSWLTDPIMQNFERITYELLNIFYTSSDKEYSRLLGGPLLRMIVDNFQNALSFNPQKIKLFMYSAHDSTIYHLFSVLGITRLKYFDFLTTIILDLYKDQYGNYEVEAFIHDDSSSLNQFETLSLPKCPYPCSLSSFIQNHQDVTSVDRTTECRI